MKKLGVLAIFVLLGLGIYFNSFKNGYHYDDGHHIVNNPFIRTTDNIPLFFTRPYTFSIRPGLHSHYRPLVMASYSLNYYLGNLHPMGFHIVNLGLHVGSAFLLFLIMQAMVGSFFIPFAAGLLFLTTPYNSEVINYISARSTVMCAFFYLLSFYFWIKYRSQKTSYLYLASFLAFTLAMLTKEIAITLPAMLWLYDVYSSERRTLLNWLNWRAYLPYLPFAFIGIIAGFILRLLFFKGFLTLKATTDMGVHFVTEAKVLAKYFYTMAIPVRLSVEHQIQGTVNIYFFLSLLFVSGLIALAILLWKGRDPLWRKSSFFIAWFFVALLPTTVVPLFQAYQENRGYLAIAGVMGLAAIGMDKLIKNIPLTERGQDVLKYSLIGALAILYAFGAVQRNQVWLNDYTLWSDVLLKNPASMQAHVGLGNYYGTLGQWDRAEAEYRAHLEIAPEDSNGLTNLAILYLRKGETTKAEELFKKSLDTNPYQITANYQMAKILQARGELPAASTHLLQILSVSPDNLAVAALLIDLYDRMGRLDEAYGRIRVAEREDPDNPAVKRALGLVYMKRDQWDAAARSYEEVLKYIPDDPKTLLDLGYVYSKLGLTELAEAKFKEALSKNPTDPLVYQALGIIYQKQGRYDDALKLYQLLLQKNPKSFRAYNNLGLIYFAKKENKKAIEAFQKALEQTPSYHMARVNLARVYEEDGKKDLARQEYQKVLKSISPEGPEGDDTSLYTTAKKRLAALQHER